MSAETAGITDVDAIEAASTACVREMALRSARLCLAAGGPDGVQRRLAGIENVWLDYAGLRIHCDSHANRRPRATVVFQPGSGAHARLYFVFCSLLAEQGYQVLAIDRPGHGLSGGSRGDCTVEEAIAVSRLAVAYARERFGLPVVLMGSSMGGLLTVFSLLVGVAPDLAVAHNFVYPGKLVSMRLRAKWIERWRRRPYPLTELVHGFERLSADPAIADYLRRRADPGCAWELSARSVASLFRFSIRAPSDAPDTLVLTGARDSAIPAWATRFFMWWAGMPGYQVVTVPQAGHLLFHDHLDVVVPIIANWLDQRVPSA